MNDVASVLKLANFPGLAGEVEWKGERFDALAKGTAMKSIHAIFENGVFRPIGPVELPEAAHVVFEPQLVKNDQSTTSLDDVYALLSRRFDSGQHDVAERHNEHQP